MTYQSNTYLVSDTVSRATNVETGIAERENKMTNIVQIIRNEVDQVQSWIDEAINNKKRNHVSPRTNA